MLLARAALEGERESFTADVQSLHELGMQATATTNNSTTSTSTSPLHSALFMICNHGVFLFMRCVCV